MHHHSIHTLAAVLARFCSLHKSRLETMAVIIIGPKPVAHGQSRVSGAAFLQCRPGDLQLPQIATLLPSLLTDYMQKEFLMMVERKQVGLFAGIAALFQEKACLFAARQHQEGPCGQFVNRPWPSALIRPRLPAC